MGNGWMSDAELMADVADGTLFGGLLLLAAMALAVAGFFADIGTVEAVVAVTSALAAGRNLSMANRAAAELERRSGWTSR